MTHAEDRHKLVMGSLNFFKTAEQVCSVLESLEKQYRSEEDFCGANLKRCVMQSSASSPLSTPATTPTTSNNDSGRDSAISESSSGDKKMAQAISKHQEQKEAFLKACTLARRNAESFLKYALRCLQYYSSRVSNSVFRNAEAKVKSILEHILEQENRVLESWATRKKRLDQCQQYVLVEHSARQALKWIKEIGEDWLNKRLGAFSSSSSSATKEEASEMYKTLTDFRVQVKETKEKVRLLIQLSENLIERGHVHSQAITSWCALVEGSFKDYTRKLDAYRHALEEKLEIRPPSLTTDSSGHSAPGDRSSDSSLESKLSCRISETGSLSSQSSLPPLPSPMTKGPIPVPSSGPVLTDQQQEMRRKSARKKEFIMAELLQTERTYVKDLEVCLTTYLNDFRSQRQSGHLPKGLHDKESLLFGNIEAIYEFHKK